ncbi:MAG: alpha/beta hydrolase [Rickettsiaceae bacterium]|nr:alpha/beta hydrolase [Rickettsiaceae bacterium]
MKKLYTDDQQNFLCYHKHISSKKKAPYVIFSHGMMSNMNKTRALYIEKYCIDNDYNFIRFDNFGNGESSSKFYENDITSWLYGISIIIEQLTEKNDIILVGSSLGGWISMLASIKFNKRVTGLITIAAASDCTEELIWNALDQSQKDELTTKGIIEVSGEGDCNHTYQITHNLIQDGRKHLLLNKETIPISCPVHLIHGMEDIDVPYNTSLRIAEKLNSNQVVTKLIKDGSHRLSRPQDLVMITNSIAEITYLLENKD